MKKVFVVLIIQSILFFLMINFVLGSEWTDNLNQDLNAYYKLDEINGSVVHDETGRWNGTTNPSNETLGNKNSIKGTSYSFISSSSTIRLPLTMYDGIKGQLTLVFWIYPIKQWEQEELVWNFLESNHSNIEMIIRYSSDSLLVRGWSQSTYQFNFDRSGSTCKPPLNNWTMITYQFTSEDGGQARFWCNDQLITEDNSVNMTSTSSFDSHNFGKSDSFHFQSFDSFIGNIDEIGWWNRYLNESEIIQLYNNGQGLTFGEVNESDIDQDGIPDSSDNCIKIINPDQNDTDTDKIGDVCDNCLFNYNPDQTDLNNDTIGNACEFNRGDLIQRIENLENLVDSLFNKLLTYLSYLPLNNKKDMVCGYMVENSIVNYADLGLKCTLLINNSRNRKCDCQAI